VRFMVFMMVTDDYCLQDVTLCNLMGIYQHFGGTSASKFRVEE
jgi:hypothetical protein